MHDPRVALLFLIPAPPNAAPNDRGVLQTDVVCEQFAVDGQAPRSVVVINVAEIYVQCDRAIVCIALWNPARHIDPATLTTLSAILAEMSDDRVGRPEYDRLWPAGAAASLW